MKEKTYLVGEAIYGENPADFNNQLKAFCKCHKVIHITYHPTVPFLAYCDYEEENLMPETLEDEFALIGERHSCGDCPLLESPTDGRRKKLFCKKSGKIKWKDSPACESFYEELKGELNEKCLSKIGCSHEGEGLERSGSNEDHRSGYEPLDQSAQWQNGIHGAGEVYHC